MQESGGVIDVSRVERKRSGSSSVVCSKLKHLNHGGKGVKSPVDTL